MHPLLFHTIPFYFVMWVCAAITGVVVGTRLAVRAGFPARRSALAIVLLALSILLGSKLLYLAEAHWFPFDDYVPFELRSSLHGFRIPGGILALAAVMPIVCGALRLDWRRFGDIVMPLVALALVFIRLGCFLNGCCFGKVSALPWAVAFPRGSWVWWYHKTHGWIAPDAHGSLPVHPLQLYFLLAGLLTLGVILRQRYQQSPPGTMQVLFYSLFFAATAVLEPIRQNRLTLNRWVVPVAAIIAGAVLLRSQTVRAAPAGRGNEARSNNRRFVDLVTNE